MQVESQADRQRNQYDGRTVAVGAGTDAGSGRQYASMTPDRYKTIATAELLQAVFILIYVLSIMFMYIFRSRLGYT